MPNTPATLGELTQLLSRIIRHRSRRLPLAPHQARALHTIAREPIRPARLAEILHVTPRAVTDVVESLVRSRLVTVESDPADRRAKIVTATDRADELLADVHRARADIAAELFSALTPAEQEHLHELLQKVADSALAAEDTTSNG